MTRTFLVILSLLLIVIGSEQEAYTTITTPLLATPYRNNIITIIGLLFILFLAFEFAMEKMVQTLAPPKKKKEQPKDITLEQAFKAIDSVGDGNKLLMRYLAELKVAAAVPPSPGVTLKSKN